ncbi:MAG: HEPN domain-containing protein [Nitrospinae bacterium]|nr:HEPN domain-containing protein [Nitrospinota bacterium]
MKAFDILRNSPEAHSSVVCFHAQQAVEKLLKAVLYLNLIEFERTHDLVKLAELLRDNGVRPPVSDDELHKLAPFAVTFRYDDKGTESLSSEEAGTITIMMAIRRWAGKALE